MTVTYSANIATANFSCFFKLLVRWRGSIYKILWKDFCFFAVSYFSLCFIYRLILNPTQKEYFEILAVYCSQFGNLIPVAFVLGFYVNHVASRWWEKFRTLPWPGRTAMYVTVHLHGHDERARLMRRTIMRYMCLSYVITMSSISPPVKKRFPSWKHMTEAGFMLANEENIINNINTPYNKFFVPLIWASALITRARKEGRIKDDFAVKTLIDEINDFRTRSFQLFNFDWVTIPLVYTQVVTLAVYTFFLSCLMGRQYLDNGHHGDMYFPFFTFLQFLFYMGWLKVAETMLNPFGEDDDDFDINYLIDRHLKVSYLVVDEMHAEHPDLIKDQYWDTANFDLPYTAASEPLKVDPLRGSALDLSVPVEKASFVPSSLPRIAEDDEYDTRYPSSVLSSSPHEIPSSHRSHRQLTRMVSKTSIASRSTQRAVGFFKTLKKSLSRRSRRGSGSDSDGDINSWKAKVEQCPSSHGSVMSKFGEKKPAAEAIHMVRIPSREEMMFPMSESDDSDEVAQPEVRSPSSFVKRWKDKVPKKWHKSNDFKTSSESKTSNDFKTSHDSVSSIDQRHGKELGDKTSVKRSSLEERVSNSHPDVHRAGSDPRAPSSGDRTTHMSIKGSSGRHFNVTTHKDGAKGLSGSKVKDEDNLSPINESLNSNSPPDDELALMSEVRDKLKLIQPNEKASRIAHQESLTSEMEILSLLGGSVRSHGASSGTRNPPRASTSHSTTFSPKTFS